MTASERDRIRAGVLRDVMMAIRAWESTRLTPEEKLERIKAEVDTRLRHTNRDRGLSLSERIILASR